MESHYHNQFIKFFIKTLLNHFLIKLLKDFRIYFFPLDNLGVLHSYSINVFKKDNCIKLKTFKYYFYSYQN